MVTCTGFGCTNRTSKKTPGLTFHRFPLRKEDLLAQWIYKVRRKNWKPTIYSRLCSDHFLPDDYRTGLKRKHLKDDAIPSIFSFTVGSRSKKMKNVKRISDLPININSSSDLSSAISDPEVLSDTHSSLLIQSLRTATNQTDTRITKKIPYHPHLKAKEEASFVTQLKQNSVLENMAESIEKIKESVDSFSQSTEFGFKKNELYESTALNIERFSKPFEVVSMILIKIAEK